MVKLTQVEDESLPKTEFVNKEDEYVDTSESDVSDEEDEFDENETFLDRIVALKDIIPPQQRTQLAFASSSLASNARTFFNKSGNVLWVVASSALLLGVPLSLSILGEQQLMEMEKEFKLQQSSNEVLAPGSEQAFQQPQTPAK